jgi:hypothetical protein
MHKIRPSLHESFAQSKAPPNPVAPLAASTLIILFVKMLIFFIFLFLIPLQEQIFCKRKWRIFWNIRGYSFWNQGNLRIAVDYLDKHVLKLPLYYGTQKKLS